MNIIPTYTTMPKENQDKINKLETFAKNPELANFEELQAIAESLKVMSEKEAPEPKEVQKVSIDGAEIITIKGEKGDKGDKGEQGIQGETGPQGEKGADSKVPGPRGDRGEVGESGLDGEDGRNGKDGENGKDGSPDTPEQVRDKLETLDGDDRLDISAIKGFDQTIEDIKSSSKKSIRIGGGSRGVQLWVNGVKKGLAQFIDIIPGSNVTISDSLVNGLHSITISSSGGSGFSTLTATETPNGSNTIFTFAGATAQPSFIIVDNVWMRAITALGTVNWTWNGGTKKATFTIPPVDEVLGIV